MIVTCPKCKSEDVQYLNPTCDDVFVCKACENVFGMFENLLFGVERVCARYGLLILLLAPLAHGQNKLNVAEQTLAIAAISADVATTRQNIGNGVVEANPFARPFVRSNGGAAAAAGLGAGAVVLSNYVFRHHPRVRHGINWTVTAIETGNAIHNSRVKQ